MKLRHLCASLLLILATSLCAFAQQGVTVSDVTGTSNIRFGVNKIIFPNGTVAISGRTATISGIGATFTHSSSITDTSSGIFLFGGAASATPTAQQFTFQNGLGANIAGANYLMTGSIGTGTGVGGNLGFQVAYPSTSSSTLNTASTVFSAFGVNNQSSGTAVANALFTITPTVNQTGTAGYDAFLVNATESAVGSGTKNLLDLAVASTSKFSISDTGVLSQAQLLAPQITAATPASGITVNNVGEVRRQTYKITLTNVAFSAAAKTSDITIATLPAKARIVAAYADVTATFSGGGESAATLKIGSTAGGVDIMASFDCFTATVTKGLADADLGTAMTRAAAIQGGFQPSWTGTTIVNARVTTTTNNTSALTQGSVTIYLTVEVMP